MWRKYRARLILTCAALGLVLLAIAGGNRNAPRGPQDAPVFRPKLAPGEDKPRGKTERLRRLPTARELVPLALIDLKQNVPRHSWKYTRYLMNPDKMMEKVRTTSLALAYASRASGITRPVVLANGYLMRVDLRHYVLLGKDQDRDLIEWLAFWELMAFDPCTSELVTRDAIALLDLNGLRPDDLPMSTVRKTRKVKRMVQERDKDGDLLFWKDPKTGRADKTRPVMIETFVNETFLEQVSAFDSKDVDVVRLNARYLGEAYGLLQEATGSAAPILDSDYLKARIQDTVKDEKVYRVVWGGLYYEFRGIRLAQDVFGKGTKVTDFDLFMEDLGIGNIKAGLTQEKLFDKLRSDQRVAILKSGVTGKNREASSWNTPAAKEGQAVGYITGDIKDGDVDVGDRSYKNLLNPRRKAREALFPAQNGLYKMALFNDKGARQDEVPPDIANDYTIPDGHTKRLTIRGCPICHGKFGDDGWMPLHNDAKTFLNHRRGKFGRLDIFDDLSSKDGSLDAVGRLVGLYQGDFRKQIRRARDDVAEYTLQATGPFTGGDGSQADVVKLAAVQMDKERYEFKYAPVDARAALHKMGWDVPKERAVAVLDDLLPPTGIVEHGIIREDPVVVALVAGLSVDPYDFALSYSFLMERVQHSPKLEMYLKEAAESERADKK